MRSLLNKIRKVVGKDSFTEKKKHETENRLKSIFAFIKKQNNQDINENFEEIESFGEFGDDKLVGRLKKKFVRLHNGYFPRLAENIKAGYPNCNFVTYLNDRRVATTSRVPENLYVLMKEMPRSATLDYDVERNQMYAEAVSPHILNYFGCKTVYNESLIKDGSFYALSLYFIEPKSRFYLALNLNKDVSISGLSKMQSNLDAIDEKLNILNVVLTHEENRKKPKIDRKKIKEEYIYSYLVRSLLLGDSDFKDRNYGFILDKEKNVVHSAPNFDLEFCFGKMAKYTLNVNENLEFIYKNYPEIINRFMSNLESIMQTQERGKPKYVEIIESNMKGDPKVGEFICIFECNAEFIQSKYKSMQSEFSLNQK